jgi:hypothetical protein
MKTKLCALVFLVACFATTLFSQTINVVVVTTDYATTLPAPTQATIDQLVANAPSGVTVLKTVYTGLPDAQAFNANHPGDTNYLVVKGLHDADGNFVHEIADSRCQNFPDTYSPMAESTVTSWGYSQVYYCYMPSWPGQGYRISNDDIGADIGKRHNITYDYAGKSFVEFCRAALDTCPGTWFFYSKWGFWGTSQEYGDYTYADILQGAHSNDNIINF